MFGLVNKNARDGKKVNFKPNIQRRTTSFFSKSSMYGGLVSKVFDSVTNDYISPWLLVPIALLAKSVALFSYKSM